MKRLTIKDKNNNCLYVLGLIPYMGASFLALAPDHKMSKLLSHTNNDIKKFIKDWEKTFSNEEKYRQGALKKACSQIYLS